MATYSVPGQDLTYNIPDIGQVFQYDANKPDYSVRTDAGIVSLGNLWDVGQQAFSDRVGADNAARIQSTDPQAYYSGVKEYGTKYLQDQGLDISSVPTFNAADVQNLIGRGVFTQSSSSSDLITNLKQYLNKPTTADTITQGVNAGNANQATYNSTVLGDKSQPTIAPQAGAMTPGATVASNVNPNAAMQVPSNTRPLIGTTTQEVDQNTNAAAQAAQAVKPALAMPANGSVVDLLNAAGQDSSYAARQQLAQQFGIQNYTGSAAQNTELAKKYLDTYNSVKGSSAPQSGAEARTALGTVSGASAQSPDPQAQFFDQMGNMNPIENQLFGQISQLMNTQSTQQSLTDLYKSESAAQGLPELNMQLADVNRIMSGTEDDIRAEITKSGGFATDSQVQALAGVRNKVLLKQAQYLSDVISAKNDYVDHVVQLTGADRDAVSKQIDEKLGIAKTVFDMTQKLQDNARQNYQSIVNAIGWDGLAKTAQNNPAQAQSIEKAFGLAPGELSALASYQKPLSEKEQLDLENQKLQNQKLIAEIAKLKPSQMDAATKALSISLQQQGIQDTDKLLTDPAIAGAVGPSANPLSRLAPIQNLTGATSNYVASVEQLRQQLTLDKLIQAKGSGATFGALSEGELSLLSASASKLGTWAVKDAAGNVIGYNVDEDSFKKEIDKINNFQKLDYVLKGGSPAAVGVQQQADGSLWVKNSDGSYTNLQ